MIVAPLEILNPVFHFLDWIIAEWGVMGCLSVSRVRLAVGVGAGLGVQRRVAPEVSRSTARPCQPRHYHTAAQTIATTNHHSRISHAG